MSSDMDSTIEAIKAMLDSPGAAQTLESLLGAFMQAGSEEESNEGAKENQQKSADTNPLEDIPIENIMKIAGAYKSLNKTSDPRINLLKAIKPYVRSERSESVDTAIKLLGFLRLAPLLGDLKDIL